MKREQMRRESNRRLSRMIRNRFSVQWIFIALFALVMAASGRDIVLAHLGVPVWSLPTKYGCFAICAYEIVMIANQLRRKSREGSK
jgi:hypothetical protein